MLVARRGRYVRQSYDVLTSIRKSSSQSLASATRLTNGVALQRISPHRLNDSEIVPDAHRAKAHIEIGEADPEQTHPCPEHVAAIETTDAAIGLVTGRRT